MAESKSQDKFFPYGLKQEGYDSNFNWPPMESDFEDFRNSNPYLIGKINNRSQQLFENFPQVSMNPEIANDQVSLTNQPDNPNNVNDQSDQSSRMNSSFPLFNEKILASGNTSGEVGINQMKSSPYTSLMMNNINNLEKLRNFPSPNNFYFPFTNNNLRRPLPQELLEEEPVYVNPKQYERIMKLRIKKAQKGMVKNSVMPLERPKDKSYKHLSRHLHAKRRERGTGGRFLSKEAQKKKQDSDDLDEGLGFEALSAHTGFGNEKHDLEDNE